MAELYVRAEVSSGPTGMAWGGRRTRATGEGTKAINIDIHGKLLHGTIDEDIYGKFSQGSN